MGHPRQDQKQAQLGHRCVAQCRANPEGLGDLFQDKEQTEDGAQGHCGGGGGLIEIAAQSAAESLDARGVPMGEIGEGAIFHFTFIAEGFAEEDGGGGIAVGDGGDVHTYLLSHTRALSRIKLPLHDYRERKTRQSVSTPAWNGKRDFHREKLLEVYEFLTREVNEDASCDLCPRFQREAGEGTYDRFAIRSLAELRGPEWDGDRRGVHG